MKLDFHQLIFAFFIKNNIQNTYETDYNLLILISLLLFIGFWEEL
ncbi:hypothetical protein SAMN05444395_1233 [Flavobacterium fryxellicola]|nr:hypothetical protein SAMN05444395_1233 [Flavobacterium fryxellicola]